MAEHTEAELLQELVDKADYEGGLTGALEYGGPGFWSDFPDIEDAAHKAYWAIQEYEGAVTAACNELGATL